MRNSPFNFRSLSVGVAALLGLSFSTCNLLADAVVIKGGERIEGKILSETDTEVTIQYQISASIKDDRLFGCTDLLAELGILRTRAGD